MKAHQDPIGFETLLSISKAEAFNKWMYAIILPFLKDPILELGSGIGNISHFILKDFSDVTLSDYNHDYCSILKVKYHLNNHLRNILSIDLQDPNFYEKNAHLKESFNCIILLNVIEHLENDKLCVEYCRFLLKKGGNLVMLAPAYQLLYSNFDKEIGHYRRYTISSLAELMKIDFKIVNKQYFNFLGMSGWFLLNKIMGRKELSEYSMVTFNKLVPIAKLLDKLLFNQIGISTIVIGERK